MQFLSEAVGATDASEEERETSKEWLKLLAPFLFGGLFHSIQTLTDTSPLQSGINWATRVDVTGIASHCLAGIGVLASSTDLLAVNQKWEKNIETSIVKLYESILLPVLSQKASLVKRRDEGLEKLVERSCRLLKILSMSSTLFNDGPNSSNFLLTLLSPLDLLQKGRITVSNGLVATIISACMDSVGDIIKSNQASAALVKSMMALVMSLSAREEKVPDRVRLASQELLKQCLSHDDVTILEHSSIAVTLAKSRDWAAWTAVVKVKDGIAAENSLIEVEKALLNPSYTGEQLTALAAIKSLIQSLPPPNELVGRIVAALGAEILSVFQAYATLTSNSNEIQSQRMNACADCMKIILAAYQQFSSGCAEDEIAEFLIVLFESLISAIRFNGLPNHPPPQGPLSDPSLGRMCAQAITHVARMTPIPFKSSMGGMSDNDRAVLEFAVRAEMSGYAITSAPAPAKKKLSLKGFKK